MEDCGLEIKLENLSCGYRGRTVFRHLDCTFRQGEAVCVLGANGVGKTTLFKTLLRQLPPQDGRILVDGTPLDRMTLKDLARVMAYVPQVRDSACQFSVLEMVTMGRSAYLPVFGAPGIRERERALETLAFLGMEDFAPRSYALLSGGEQQMVLLARAMVQDARFILLDEPASNLDFCNQKIMLEALLRLKTRTGILMISHMPEHAFACCDKVLLLNGDGSYLFGDTDRVITEERLDQAFRTEMVLAEKQDENGKCYRSCCLKL